MLPSYIFDETFNLNKLFQNTPPPTIPADHLPPLPKNWLTQFENSCREYFPLLEKNIFFKHVGENSKYKLKKILIEQLAIVYLRFSGKLDSQLGPLDDAKGYCIVQKLTEDIKLCTPGFHNRVIDSVNSFQIPNHIDQLLYLIRDNTIQGIAAVLTHNIDPIYQVHLIDRVRRIAKKEGLGIEPHILRDRYKSSLSGELIRNTLKEEFPKHYTAFTLPFLLTEQLQSFLNRKNYTGPEDTGYSIGIAENLVFAIERFLLNPSKLNTNKLCSFFILDEPDEWGDPTRIYDINWALISSLFYQQLIKDNYFIKDPIPVNLFDYAHYQTLLPDKANLKTEALFIEKYLDEKNFVKLVDDLILIKDKFPSYNQQLMRNSVLINCIDNLLIFINDANFIKDNTFEKKIELVYRLIFSQNSDFILSKIIRGYPEINPLNLKSEDINHDLLLNSIRYHPEITSLFFNFLFNQAGDLNQLFKKLLLKKNSEGSNLLMLAGRYHVKTLEIILDIIKNQITNGNVEIIRKLFLTQNNIPYNFISLAAKYRGDALGSIFSFMLQYPDLFNLEFLKKLFLQENIEGWNFLYLLIRYQPGEIVKNSLDFITKKIDPYYLNKTLATVIFESPYAGNLLSLAAKTTSQALNSLLNFTDEHLLQLEDHALQKNFLHQNNDGWHCLHVAARYQSKNVQLILQFITTHIAKFSTHATLPKLFLLQNKNADNILHLAAYNQPDSISGIFDFIAQHSGLFNDEILTKLFLQQNSEGWNFLSAAHCQPKNVKIILDFIKTKFSVDTIQEIILQRNKNQYTCLHLAVRFQPNSIKNILDFIGQHIDRFEQQFEKLLLIKNKQEQNLLLLSLTYQPDSAIQLLSFLNRHIHRFAELKSDATFKKFVCQTFLLIKDPTLIKMTHNSHSELLVDNFYRLAFNQTAIQRKLFFSINMCCSKQLKAAAQAFKDLLKKDLHTNDLVELKTLHPAVEYGELGKLYQLLKKSIETPDEQAQSNVYNYQYQL